MSIRPDGSDARPIFGSRQPWPWVVNLAYSPDRQRILFHGGGDIHVARRDGSGVVRLESRTDRSTSALDEPRWSPDGNHVLATQFANVPEAAKGTVWILAADGRAQTRFPLRTGSEAMWTQDGLVAVMPMDGAGPDWAYARLDGSVARRVGPERHLAIRKTVDEGSPDGRWWVWVSPLSGLYLMPADTTYRHPEPSERQRFSSIRQIFSPVRWSPDGTQVAVLANCGASGLDQGELVVVTVATGAARTIASNVFCRGGFDW